MIVFSAADTKGCEDLWMGMGGLAGLGIPPNSVFAEVDPLGGCPARISFSAPVPGGIQVGTDYHLALTVDYANKIARLFLDGQQVASQPLRGKPIDRNMQVTIGEFQDGDISHAFGPFNGLIDEVEVFSRPLSAGEIHAIFAADSAGKCR